MKFVEFINKYLGKKVDFDGAYGAQCVDLFRQYCKDVLGIKEHTGAVEGAKDLYLNYEILSKEQKYFERILPYKLKYGDVAIWNGTSSNKYGHVAVYICDVNKNNILVFEQNGFSQDGAKVKVRTRENLLGGLHFKEAGNEL